MKKPKQILHEECKKCFNLRVLSVYMDGSAYYCCNRTPNHVEKDKHTSPCHKFKPENNYYIVCNKNPFPTYFLGEHGDYVSTIIQAERFRTEEDAKKHIPDNEINWEVVHCDWIKTQRKLDEVRNHE